MDLRPKDPPREFAVGHITISHVADVELQPDEQLTLVTKSGTEFDVARKDWGYYATPSLNSRLPAHGLRAVLAIGGETPPRMCLMLVESGHEAEFERYLEEQGMSVAAWLDTDEAVAEAARRLAADE